MPLASHLTSENAFFLQAKGCLDLSQKSTPLQALPSSLAAQSPSWTHSQMVWLPTHLPPLQVSPLVHELPSSQLALLGTLTQPRALSQLSAVQGLPSLQTVADLARPTQAPCLHRSGPVQASLSSQPPWAASVLH